MTQAEFEALTPYQRGYAVYMLGCLETEPNVPDEKNPYPQATVESLQWNTGNYEAMMAAQDSEE